MSDEEFDWPHARDTDPDTSHEAAESTDITAQCLQVLKAYVSIGRPITDHDAYRFAGIQGARQRCADLRHAGLIERTGARGMTPSGKAGYLCTYTGKAIDYLISKGIIL